MKSVLIFWWKALKNNCLQECHQSAYRKNHSTETALLKITNDLLCEIDSGHCSLLVMLDQSAAFDTVNQDILMKRLQSSYGIADEAHKWLSSYFRQRHQSVCVAGKSSQLRELVTGFPQGSVLGPFSYPVYTSPLFGIARQYNVNMHMYADDTQIYVSFDLRDTDTAVQNLERCMSDIRKWMSQNHLKLNESKTELLMVGSQSVREKCNLSSLTIGNERVTFTNSARNIGVILDSGLTMADHIHSVTRSCYLQLHKISRIRPFLTEDAAATLIRSLVLSKLDYSNSLLYGLPDVLLEKLQLVQNNAVRLVKRRKKTEGEHITPLLKDLHWLPIKSRIIYKINMITYKAINGIAPEYVSDMIEPHIIPRTLRSTSKQLLQEKRTRLKRSGDRAYSVCGPKLWNQVPKDIRNSNTLDSFKSGLKTFLFKQAYN